MATTSELAIDLHDVTKVYKGRVHALQGIEMRVRRGDESVSELHHRRPPEVHGKPENVRPQGPQ